MFQFERDLRDALLSARPRARRRRAAPVVPSALTLPAADANRLVPQQRLPGQAGGREPTGSPSSDRPRSRS